MKRRELIIEGATVDWTGIRSLNREIDLLFTHEIALRREEHTINNLIVKVQTRAPAT